MEDPDLKTAPAPTCEGAGGCEQAVEVIFLRTGVHMCALHALALLSVQEREERDTDRAVSDGSPPLPPLSRLVVDDDSPASLPPESEDVSFPD